MNLRASRGGWSGIKAVFLAALFFSFIQPPEVAAPPAQWAPRGPGGGGAFFAPSFSPYSPGEMYLTTDMSDVYHSTNYGASWSVLDFRQIQGGRQAMVQFTSDPRVRYAVDYSGDASTPTRSVDGGVTWQQLPGDPTGGGAFALFADPGSTNRVLVSDYTTIYFSVNGGASFNPEHQNTNGLYVAGAFFEGANIYAATGDGMLVSTNGGASFALTVLGGINLANETMFSFAGAKKNGTTRFICDTLHPADVFPGLDIESAYYSYIGIYTLDWGQANWRAVTNGIAAVDYPVFVAMAQNDVSTAYVAGQQTNTEFPVLYKTTNGGTNWQSALQPVKNQNVFTGWAGNGGDRDWSYGAGALGLAVAPNDSSRVAYSDLGFAHVSTNGGAFWKQAYVNPADQNPTNALITKGRNYRSVGLEDTSCWDLTWADSNHIVAGYTDIKGAISADAGNSWSFGYSGHALNTMYYCVKHPASGILYAGTSTIHDMYQSTRLNDSILDAGRGEVLFSSDQGVTWRTNFHAGHPVVWLATDPNRANTLYASVIHSTLGGIFVSTNIQNGTASTWTKLANQPPRTQGHPFNVQVLNDGTLLCSFSARQVGSTKTFTASSGVFISTNSGTSWLDRSGPNMTYWTMDVVVDPNDAAQNTWYAGVYSGYGGFGNNLGGLYRTTNRGVAWARLNDMGGGGVSSCTFNPLNANELYVTTEQDGLLVSTNINAATPTFTTDPNYPFRQPERVFFNPYQPTEVWVTSFGNGLRVGSTAAAALPGTLHLSAPQGGTAAVSLGQATPGAAYAFQESTDFTNWLPIGTNAAGGDGVVQFSDTNATNVQRFYRSLAQ